MATQRTELVRAVGRIVRAALSGVPDKVTRDPKTRARLQEELEDAVVRIALRLRDEAPGLLAAQQTTAAELKTRRGAPAGDAASPNSTSLVPSRRVSIRG